jgi:multicomponent Na+:H+ antiporter subunit E
MNIGDWHIVIQPFGGALVRNQDTKRADDPGHEPHGFHEGEGDDYGLVEDRSPPGTGRLARFAFSFPLFFLFWIIFSGQFDSFHLSLGVISCALVAHLSSDLLFTKTPTLKHGLKSAFKFISYLPYLMYEIFKSNIHMIRITLHPRALELIHPNLVRFRTKLKDDLARVTFANSITLTPGTITVRMSMDGDMVIHAIDETCGQALPGEMEQRVARAFEED